MGSILRRPEDLGLESGSVILTFDDGPVGEGRTAALLDLLARHEIRAGFCVIGQEVERQPELCRRIHEEGHLLINHGYLHISPMALSEPELAADMERCDAAIGQAIGQQDYRSAWFRPPGGILNERVERVLAQTERTIYPITCFGWDIFPMLGNQWRIATILKADLKKQRTGVYILHECIYPLFPTAPRVVGRCPWLLPVVEEFIAEVRRQGAEFVGPERLA
jgi:peptidoglycan/xylan/chitin deacetylase (PgdA/CDA1 family)